MKRRDLIAKIRAAATGRGLTFEQLREGANHTVFAVGGLRFIVPRHREINEYTAEGIMKELAEQLGADWWRQ